MAKKKSATGAKTKQADSTKTVSFEDAITELTKIVNRLENGELGLDDSLNEYEAGVKHLARCHDLLSQAERKIRLLQKIDSDGNPITSSFNEEDASLEEKAQSRGRRRSSPKRPGPTKPARNRGTSGNNNVDESRGLF